MSIEMLEKSIGWQKSLNIATAVYKITETFPKEERYGLTSQIRRCGTSILFNIAEGILKHSKKDFANYLTIARGSCGELYTQLVLCEKLGYIDHTACKEIMIQLEEIIKILQSSIKTLRKR